MTPQSTSAKTRRHKVILAAPTGLVSGVIRALIGWALNHPT